MLRFLYFLALLLLPATSIAQLLASDHEKVKINLGWSHQFQFAGYYAALEKGYFEEEGLDVELFSDIVADNLGKVIDGTYDYGVATGGLFLEDERYKELTIVEAIYQQSPVSLLTMRDGEINSLKDLEGTTIIGGTEIKTMLVSAGVDITKIHVESILSDFKGLVKRDIAATSFFITDQALLIGSDSLKFKIWRPIEYGIQFYGDCLFTSRSEANSNPERVEKVRRAVIRGWDYAIEHQDEVIHLILEKYASNRNHDILVKEANIIIHTLILPKFYDIGDMQLSRWNEMAKVLYEFGVIDEPRNLNGFLFEAEPKLPQSLKILLIVALIVIAATAASLFVLYLYNRQLRKAVHARTLSLEKANRELDRFVYSISHDIRSPLTSIQGIINIIRIEPQNLEQYLAMIESSVKKLDRFTRDILDYTRNSRAKLEPKLVDLQDMISKTVDQIKYIGIGEAINVRIDVDTNREFNTDPWRLEVILSNLLANAIKYCDPQKQQPFVQVRARVNSAKLQLVIEDNGKGIGEEHLDKIFDMFYRASEDSQGSGLGLYIVKETVNLLGGTIDIQSEKDKGTTVTVTIPEKRQA